MVAEGAAIIDVGGESTRPGAAAVSIEEELRRVVPVIKALTAELSVPVSIDTSKPEVMRAAIEAGAGFINDVYALRAPGALQAAAMLGVPVCLMHMQGEPRTMQQNPSYGDVMNEVSVFFAARVQDCLDAGLSRAQLLIDPGFGFGKTVKHNLQLLNGLDVFQKLGLPVLVGLSRKSFLGAVLGSPVEARLHAGLVAATVAVLKGVVLVRTHDVAPTVEALKLCAALASL